MGIKAGKSKAWASTARTQKAGKSKAWTKHLNGKDTEDMSKRREPKINRTHDKEFQ